MHGIVHKTLEAYVVERTDDDTWETVRDRAGVEPTLYLSVSRYDDREIDAILTALSSMATQERRAIERDFGRRLAPELLATFDAHLRETWDPFALLENLESVLESVESSTEAELPAITTSRESPGRVDLTYRTHRQPGYCGVAHGVLEGVVDAADVDATVAKRACVRDGDEACVFRIVRT